MSGEKKGDEDCDFSKFAYHLAGRDASFIMGFICVMSSLAGCVLFSSCTTINKDARMVRPYWLM